MAHDIPFNLPVILLSHRGPISFKRVRGERRVTRGAGGLVSALTGLAGEISDSVWVCSATTPEDRKVVDEYGDDPVRVGLEPPRVMAADEETRGATVQTRMVAVDRRRHEDFYTVIANPLLWFVQHSLYGRAQEPVLGKRERRAYSNGYVSVNRRFAEAVTAQVQAHGGRALVMLHDYHFYLVGDLVRRGCPDAVITHFVHIPWPGPDEWRVLPTPMREELLRGLLGCDVVAFHTRRFAQNFLMCCREVLGLDVDLSAATVSVQGRTVQARHYAISVDVGAMERLAATPKVRKHRQRLTATYLDDGRQLVLRVDRTDPSKNIPRGFRAFDLLLTDHPELHGRVTFYAICQPSRQDVAEYSDYLASIGAVVAEVNARHGGDGWQPIVLLLEDDLPLAVAAYSVCDVLLVNAVNDGMNLVAKEMTLVNTRNGVLLLSENTGAHEELGPHALTLQPFDVQQQADALYTALTMDPAKRRELLVGAADVVRRGDVSAWFAEQLADLETLLGDPPAPLPADRDMPARQDVGAAD